MATERTPRKSRINSSLIPVKEASTLSPREVELEPLALHLQRPELSHSQPYGSHRSIRGGSTVSSASDSTTASMAGPHAAASATAAAQLPHHQRMKTLRRIIVAAIILQTLIVGLIIGLFAVFTTADIVREATQEMQEHVNSKLAANIVFLLDSVEVAGRQSGEVAQLLNYGNGEQLQAFLHSQIKALSSAKSLPADLIHASFPNGEWVGVGFEEPEYDSHDQLHFYDNKGPNSTLVQYQVNTQGTLGDVFVVTEYAMIPTEHEWYRDAAKAGGNVTWYDGVAHEDFRRGVAVTVPVLDSLGGLSMVLQVDVSSLQLEKMLRDLVDDECDLGVVYIVTTEGVLIAVSTGFFNETVSLQNMQNIRADSCNIPLVENTFQELPANLEEFVDKGEPAHLRHGSTIIHAQPISYPMKWIVVNGIQRDRFLEKAQSEGYISIILCCVVLVTACCIAYFVTRRLTRPLRALTKELRKLQQPQQENLFDLEAPATKILKVLRKLKLAAEELLPQEYLSDLETALDVFTRNQKLWAPNLSSQLGRDNVAIDEDTKSWLMRELVKGESRSRKRTDRNRTPSKIFQSGSIMEPQMRQASPSTAIDARGQTELLGIMNSAFEWSFDIFRVAELTNGQPLYFLGSHLVHLCGNFETLNVPEEPLLNFIKHVERGYHADLPYHNSIHAADVTQTVFWFLNLPALRKHLTDMEVFAAILAAMIHDYDHDGLSNTFHVNANHPKALLYNDRSVLAAFMLTREEDTNPFKGLTQNQYVYFFRRPQPPDEYREVRQLLVDMVLMTDISHHFESLGKFKALISAGINPANLEDRRMLLKMFLKCADVSNPAKPSPLYSKWTERIMEEFYLQGDKERELGMPISPFMDRQKPVVDKCQRGFIDFIVKPLYEALNSVFEEDCSHTMDHLAVNRAKWDLTQSIDEENRRIST